MKFKERAQLQAESADNIIFTVIRGLQKNDLSAQQVVDMLQKAKNHLTKLNELLSLQSADV